MKKVRIGIVGVGGMGSNHARSLKDTPKADLVAVCDIRHEVADRIAGEHGCTAFYEAEDLYRSGKVEAVIIATPHYMHTPLSIQAFEHGLHVLVEKPIAVHKSDAEMMIAAHARRPDLKFAAMFNQRPLHAHKKIKALIDSGELGPIRRINWIITDWFRSQAYYDSGTWRATWKGEGGGVLLNQCPHQLDLFQWFFGMPKRIHAFCGLGKSHRIEVEDDVTAYMEFPDGQNAVFITSTGDAPGTNRLEITADRGRLIYENGKITFDRSTVSVKEFIETTQTSFDKPEMWHVDIPFPSDQGSQHQKIIANFADAILDGTPLFAQAEEGIRSLEIGNAILLSSMSGRTVELPVDGEEYKNLLERLIANKE